MMKRKQNESLEAVETNGKFRQLVPS